MLPYSDDFRCPVMSCAVLSCPVLSMATGTYKGWNSKSNTSAMPSVRTIITIITRNAIYRSV